MARTDSAPRWQGRIITDPSHAHDLDQVAAMREFGGRVPRAEAEEQAHSAYRRDHHVTGAAFHLAGMRAAQAAGEPEDAKKHGAMYLLHLQHLGYDPADGVPDPVKTAAASEQRDRAHKFRAHRSDALLLTGENPLTKAQQSERLWHGTKAPGLRDFRLGGAGSEKGTIWATDSRQEAARFGHPVRVEVASKNPMHVDYGGEVYDPDSVGKLITQARTGGHDALVIRRIRNFEEGGASTPSTTSHVIFHPSQIWRADRPRDELSARRRPLTKAWCADVVERSPTMEKSESKTEPKMRKSERLRKFWDEKHAEAARVAGALGQMHRIASAVLEKSAKVESEPADLCKRCVQKSHDGECVAKAERPPTKPHPFNRPEDQPDKSGQCRECGVGYEHQNHKWTPIDGSVRKSEPTKARHTWKKGAGSGGDSQRGVTCATCGKSPQTATRREELDKEGCSGKSTKKSEPTRDQLLRKSADEARDRARKFFDGEYRRSVGFTYEE